MNISVVVVMLLLPLTIFAADDFEKNLTSCFKVLNTKCHIETVSSIRLSKDDKKLSFEVDGEDCTIHTYDKKMSCSKSDNQLWCGQGLGTDADCDKRARMYGHLLDNLAIMIKKVNWASCDDEAIDKENFSKTCGELVNSQSSQFNNSVVNALGGFQGTMKPKSPRLPASLKSYRKNIKN